MVLLHQIVGHRHEFFVVDDIHRFDFVVRPGHRVEVEQQRPHRVGLDAAIRHPEPEVGDVGVVLTSRIRVDELRQGLVAFALADDLAHLDGVLRRDRAVHATPHLVDVRVILVDPLGELGRPQVCVRQERVHDQVRLLFADQVAELLQLLL